ncbi:MAG: efflux transporter outer membrane subunit [Desulfococcaceae bacterium]
MKKNSMIFGTEMCRFSRKMPVLTLFLCLCLLQSCRSAGPDYVPPETQMPDAWHMELFRGMSAGGTAAEKWWKVFDDPALDSLMQRAAEGSLNLKQAYARINESRALLGYAKGEQFPDVNGKGSAQRHRRGEDLTSPLADNPDNYFSLGLDSSWEADFWGRIRRSVESAEAGYHASVENYRDVMVRVCAEVASVYTDVRTLQDRIRFAQSNIKAQRESLRITKARVEAGIAPELDVRQAELNLARTESTLPSLKSALVQSVNRLGILIGKEPEILHGELSKPGSIPKPPKEILVPIPANLLRQRPDIRQAERQLAAQTARIGVATAALYPTLTFSGSIGIEASSGLFDAASRYWSLAPSFRWNLFDGGRVRSQIQAEEARTEQSLAVYEQTVLSALEDVENSLAAYANESIRLDTLKRSVAAAQKSVVLVQSLYKTGLTDFQNVLDMERTLFEQQDSLAASQGLVTQNLIRIYKAVGGGWSAEFPAEPKSVKKLKKGKVQKP